LLHCRVAVDYLRRRDVELHVVALHFVQEADGANLSESNTAHEVQQHFLLFLA